MATGIVKKWFGDRGFGFITPDAGGEAVMVHMKALQNGHDYLSDGEAVTYDLGINEQKGKPEVISCSGGFRGGEWKGRGAEEGGAGIVAAGAFGIGAGTSTFGKAMMVVGGKTVHLGMSPPSSSPYGGKGAAVGGDEVCKNFKNWGECRFGDNCRFVHEDGGKGSAVGGVEVCRNFKNWGECKLGENCRFVHVGGDKVTATGGQEVCKNFQKWGECKFGDACRFMH